jgi:hypothetical protein
MQRLEVSCAVHHIYIYVVSRLRVNHIHSLQVALSFLIALSGHKRQKKYNRPAHLSRSFGMYETYFSGITVV